jgi:hypothetical protein
LEGVASLSLRTRFFLVLIYNGDLLPFFSYKILIFCVVWHFLDVKTLQCFSVQLLQYHCSLLCFSSAVTVGSDLLTSFCQRPGPHQTKLFCSGLAYTIAAPNQTLLQRTRIYRGRTKLNSFAADSYIPWPHQTKLFCSGLAYTIAAPNQILLQRTRIYRGRTKLNSFAADSYIPWPHQTKLFCSGLAYTMAAPN